MIVYQSSKEGFLKDVLTNDIDTIIHQAFFEHLGRHTSFREVQSWQNSMLYMNNLLSDTEIPGDVGISIEYQIPLTSKRIDFIISGLNEQQEGQVIIIELKQWSEAQLTDKDAIVKTRFYNGISEIAHPSYQAWSYAATIRNYNQTVQEEKISLIPCAYLHNYSPDDIITNSFYQEHIEKAPVFLKPDAIKLRHFIKKHIKYGDKHDILYKIENGRLRPSKQLADSLASMLKGNQEFIMLDDQKIVFETALALAKQSDQSKKHVLIVEGGPGTGKSVVAVNLLVEFTKNRMVTKYVSKNAAPRAVYAAKLTNTLRKTTINNLFGGSGAFYDEKPNLFDALIVDEAHRLNFKSGIYQTYGENQVLEIINASKFSIFFVDDNQKIHIKDIGSKAHIQKCAESKNARVTILKLESQFRCNGSEGYLAWLDNSLQINDTANILLSEEDFDFKIFSDPNELRNVIIEKNNINNKSRLVAGYCWDWNSKKVPEENDVIIPEFNFKMKWNLDKDGSTWIIAENSINEIGCIHTCQGLEVDYIGVIIGNDLRYKNDKVTTDVTQRSKQDNSVKGIKTLIDKNPEYGRKVAEQIIKNTYRTLMTRGMKGCYVYFCDKELEKYFRNRIKQTDIQPTKVIKESVRVEPVVNDNVKYIDFLPLYSLKAACGAFGEWQIVDENGWIKVDGLGRLSRNMFIVKAVGKSMEPKIMDGDFCVFKANVAGSRNNKIVLVQHNNYFDSENQGRYSIKKYTSEKAFDKDTGEWMHEKIILMPINSDYEPIILEEEDGFMVIGEFIGVIK